MGPAGIGYKWYFSYVEWKRHLGEKWDIFYQRKMKLDPKERLSPGQNIFTPREEGKKPMINFHKRVFLPKILEHLGLSVIKW